MLGNHVGTTSRAIAFELLKIFHDHGLWFWDIFDYMVFYASGFAEASPAARTLASLWLNHDIWLRNWPRYARVSLRCTGKPLARALATVLACWIPPPRGGRMRVLVERQPALQISDFFVSLGKCFLEPPHAL